MRTVFITWIHSLTGFGRNGPHPNFPPFSMCSFSVQASSCSALTLVVSGKSMPVSSATGTSVSIEAIESLVARESSRQKEVLPLMASRNTSAIHE